jgi:hypothetical protein
MTELSASGAGALPGMGSTGPADAATEVFMRYVTMRKPVRSASTSLQCS